jgi:uncharacterized protein YbaR (Trm112 family)
MAKTKLTAKEKRQIKRIEKKMTTRYCKEVTELGFCKCPYCERLLLCGFGSLPKVGLHICEGCNKKFVISEEIANLVKERCERFEALLNKIRPYGKEEIANIEKAIDNNCDINEVAMLCRYYGCDITKLSCCVKKMRAL